MKRILLVEDVPEEQRVYSSLLSIAEKCFSDRPVIEVASTMGEAKTRVNFGGIDVVILDLGLPDSGTEKTIAALPSLSKEWPPIVVMTAALGVRTRCILAGADDFMDKKHVNHLPETLWEKCYHAWLKRTRK